MKASPGNVRPLGEVARMVKNAKAAGKKVVTTNGCFDILHIGHVRYLDRARKLGDMLVVGVNSDSSVRALKGAGRPIQPARERAEVVAALRSVDAVFIFSETTPVKWLTILKPHIHVKGGDRTMREIVEKEVVEKSGGTIVIVPLTKGRSSSRLIKKIRG